MRKLPTFEEMLRANHGIEGIKRCLEAGNDAPLRLIIDAAREDARVYADTHKSEGGPAGLDPLPRCIHDVCLLDGSGEVLEPTCGCRWTTENDVAAANARIAGFQFWYFLPAGGVEDQDEQRIVFTRPR